MKNIINWAGRIVYGVISLSLAIISLAMIIVAVWNVWVVWTTANDNSLFVSSLLDAIGLIVIGMAVFDVSNYLLEEEVVGRSDKKSPAKQRSTLIKFLIIIAIAVSLEALMFVFDAGKKDITTLLYPTLLLVASVLIIVGLGIYQKLTIDESKV